MAHGYLGQAYLQKKMYYQAIAEFRNTVSLSPSDMSRKAELANAYAQAGKTEQAREILQEFLLAPSGTYISPYAWATLYAGMERKQDTLEWLDKGFAKNATRAW